jgi:Toprim domain
MAQKKTNDRSASKDEDQGPTLDQIKAALAERAAEFASYVLQQEPSKRNSNSVRFYPHGSLVVNTGGANKGSYYNFADDQDKGSMLDLWMNIQGGSLKDAIEAAKGYLNMGGVDLGKLPALVAKDPKETAAEEEAARQKKIGIARWIWDSSSETDGREEGLQYLKNRGIEIEPPKDRIRFRRLSRENLLKMGVKESNIPSTPVVAIVLRATNAQDDTTAVQQILTTQGKRIDKVMPDFGPAKLTNGDLTGSAVKLGGNLPDMVQMAEGPETGLSVFAATNKPTWITLGTSNYTTIQLPKTVQTMIVASDMESSGTGLASALRAAQHWDKMGVPKVGIAIPPKTNDGDFNDTIQAFGPAAVARAFDKAFYGQKNWAPNALVVTPDPRAAFHVWRETGIETAVRIPGINGKTGARSTFHYNNLVQDHHTQIFLIPREGYPMAGEGIAKEKPDAVVTTLAENSAVFLQEAKKSGYVQKLMAQKVFLHTPSPLDTDKPVAFCLRRADADALHAAGHRAVAVRATGIDHVDLGFMKGRKAIVCPIGTGTPHDDKLTAKLEEAGAQTVRLTWQLFHPEGTGFKLARDTIPPNYGAADAVGEGWKGPQMAALLRLSAGEQTPPVDLEQPKESSAKPNKGSAER